tara:strand:+ start:5913 stop:6884 length:972 start_codon:yes stop_codon:yes gene_type:complete
MKYYETHFEEYVNSCIETNLHPELVETFESFPENVQDMRNIILYGKNGSGKYTQALYLINRYSPSNLKYEKKMSLSFAKSEYIIKISDIHFEVDMSLLGCNAKLLWHEMFNQIVDIINGRPNKSGIILCKNMTSVNNDLLDIFYSYIQNNKIAYNTCIKYIFLSESVCFLPENILNCCEVIGVCSPGITKIKKIVKKHSGPSSVVYNDKVKNIKNLYVSSGAEDSVQEKIISNIKSIINSDITKINFGDVRESIYELFIYEVDIHECVWSILCSLVESNKVNDKLGEIIGETQGFFKLYNNNYRPIYHVEKYVYFLMKKINGI